MLILWKNSSAIKKCSFFFLNRYIFKKNVYFVGSCVAQMRHLQVLSCYTMLNVKVESQPESSVYALNTVATEILKMLYKKAKIITFLFSIEMLRHNPPLYRVYMITLFICFNQPRIKGLRLDAFSP